MRLSALLAALPSTLNPRLSALGQGDADPVIRNISYDSRAVTQGELFVALRGSAVDGHRYLEEALALGAVALIVEEIPEGLTDVPVVCVSDSRHALALLAARYYGNPSSGLQLIGITGTNGKTSCSYLVESILNAAKKKVGLIGTIEIRYSDQHQRAVNTTPESLDLQRSLRAMLDQGIQAVSMEVSSHGTSTGRVRGCSFEVAAFTNLTQDHLDFHGTMEEYLASKLLLFSDHLSADGTAVINIDDPSAPRFLEAARATKARIIHVSRDPQSNAEVVLESAEIELQETRARIQTPSGPLCIQFPLIGDFNIENLLVAVGIASALEINLETMAKGIAGCPQVPGRIEQIESDSDDAPTVLVDYAHTPDAIDKLLGTVRPLTQGKLITVFGCGGDRDRSKRPLMAEAVARWSDRAIATSDNPRTEDPSAILEDVVQGLSSLRQVEPEVLPQTEGAFSVIADRRGAIELAISSASADDTVVLAGKGHEDYQIIGLEKFPFDDRREAARALRMRGAK